MEKEGDVAQGASACRRLPRRTRDNRRDL